MNFNHLMTTEYLDYLASSSPTPGGGAVVAFIGSQAIALLSMACNLTLGKKKFKEVEEEISSLLKGFEHQRKKLFNLAQDDINAFEMVMKAYKLPKNNKSEISIRYTSIQSSLKASSEVPFEVFNLCFSILPLAIRLKEIGNPMLQSDVVISINLLQSCIQNSVTNIEINLENLDDELFCSTKRDHIANHLEHI